ncbi:MAG: hypothetical protein QN122_07610 [Armatimonadota bacterium]|nr:hypothetical protein [Armatimonadota bacterium]MDR7449297.1 hypothetical protein [Armatimonadota bacterium]MDR7459639.1 hypothetical protein [Armatimonadota bacterium]MDR7480579.1 hypothetical protein [Armatimonadota bacterium]MDR7489275.1 hypothetical protein [Armatimonadota bacterium]
MTHVAAAYGGALITLRWESPTYRATHELAFNQELLYTEAAFATAAIMRYLQEVRQVRFVILHRNRVLATGQGSRSGVRVRFAPELGGGEYVPPAQPEQPARSGGGGSANAVR